MSIKENFLVVEINKRQAKELITKYHYLGGKGFRFGKAYGLLNKIKDELVGCAVYHSPSAPETVVGSFGLKREEQSGIWELGRFVLSREYNGGNYGSFLIGQSIKRLRKETDCKALITYADNSLHYGALYQATNFTYCGLTAKKKDFWIKTESGFKKKERGKTKGVEGEWRDRPQKHRYVMVFSENLTLKWKKEKYTKNIHKVS